MKLHSSPPPPLQPDQRAAPEPTTVGVAVHPNSNEAAIIKDCIKQLADMAQFNGAMSNTAQIKLLHTAGGALRQARNHSVTAYQAAKAAYQEIWPVSLQASFALALHSLSLLDDTDYESMGCRAHHKITKYNNALKAAVAANSRLQTGKHIINYNTADIHQRITNHIHHMKNICPNFRFPASVNLPSFIS